MPSSGYVEFFAGQVSFHMAYPGSGIEECRQVCLAPKILSHATASVTYAAIELETP